MADYYSILKKTIASLPESNGSARRSVYSRARNAIVNQLKAYEPPLSPSEITSEQLRLEEAIRKVEAEAARETLGLNQQKTAKPAPAPAPKPAAAEVQPAAAEAEAPVSNVAATQASADDVPSPLQETISEAEGLGSAANMAVQSATEAVERTAEPVAPEPQHEREEPAFAAPEAPQPAVEAGIAPEDVPAPGIPDPDPDLYADREPADQVRVSRKTKDRGAGKAGASEILRSSNSSAGKMVPYAVGGLLIILLIVAGVFFLMPGGQEGGDMSASLTTEPEPAPVTQVEDVPATASPEDDGGTKNTDRLLDAGDVQEPVAPDARSVTTTTITPEEPEAEAAPVTAPTQPAIVSGADPAAAPAEPAPVAVPENDLSAVVPQDQAVASDPGIVSGSGAQRVILYEEGDESNGSGTAAQGAVLWSLGEETNIDGNQLAVLIASIEVPERNLKVGISIKPNDDTSLPASHLVEITYDFPEDFAAGDVVNVPGLVMKPTEEARGDALVGASVKVSPGIFWIALSSLPNERDRNLALLRERGWIDIPMLYENGKRGILTIEKGAPGADAVEKAVAAWQAG